MERTRKSRLINALWFCFFFLMIFMPRQLQGVKIALMLVIFGVKAFQKSFGFNFSVDGKPRNFLIFWFSHVLLAAAIGLIRGNPGALASLRMGGLYVVIFLLLFLSIDRLEEAEWINQVIIFSGVVVAVYSIMSFLVNIGIWPRRLFYAFDYTTNVGMHEGYVHLTNTNGSMLIWILPFTIVKYLTSGRNGKRNRQLLISTGIMILAAILTGRRIIWLTIPFAALFLGLVALKNPSLGRGRKKAINWKKVGVAAGLFLLVFLFLIWRGYLNIGAIIARFQAVLRGGEEAAARTDQAKALLEGFLRNPIFGAGAGASAEGSIRNVDFTWAYELSYHAMLFQTGIVGTGLFVLAMWNIVSGCLKGMRRKNRSYSSYLALLAGLLMGFIANATNPYFSSSFDFLWWILWPVGYTCTESRYAKSYGLVDHVIYQLQA